MKTISLLSAILILPATSLLAQGQSEIKILRARMDAQEQKMTQLENALNRLTGSPIQKTPALAKKSSQAVPVKATQTKSEVSGQKYVVKKGDTLTRIAHHHHTTVELIKKENGLKSDGLRIGQKLKIVTSKASAVAPKSPTSQKAVVSKSSSPTPSAKAKAVTGKHTVKAGETFYGIAKRYKMSEATLQAANPNAKPTLLQIGQVLVIDGTPRAASKPSHVAQKSTSQPSKKKNSSVAKKAPVKNTSVAKAPEKKSASTSSSMEVSKKRKSIRTITVLQQMTYGDFASKHGASTSQLNSLNGLNLSKSTMLAKGSELYVPQY